MLRGDPDQVAAVADALEFEHKYTSGVIAWAPEDQPKRPGHRPGARRGRADRLGRAGPGSLRVGGGAAPRGHGGVHVHVLAARCDLETGKSLNIAPPGWEQTYGPLVEACNLDHGWSRPDDPARAREQQPGHRAYIEAAALRAGIAQEADPREADPGTTCCRASSPGRCRTGPAWSRPYRRRASTCRARARTT